MRFARQAGRLLFFIGLGLLTFPLQGFGVGHIIVYANDSSSASAPPPATTTLLDAGSDSQDFGTNTWITFANVAAGIHTVEVATAESGYLIRQSPTDPNAVDDPDSEYGNPRHIEVVDNQPTYPSFLFDPIVTVSAVARDAWTMERIEDATIEFVVNSGPYVDLVYSEYPWEASYATNWVSDAEGNFPANTILYLDSYDLNITCSGYELFSSNNIITNALAGDELDLGTLFLYPIDNNTNQIADAWETHYFGSGTTVISDADTDGDGMGNRDEYVAGTDPTNWYSCLWLEPISGSNSFHLAWDTEPDRTYCISGTTNLCTDTWVQVAGPWEATNGQVEIFWAETNLNLSWNNNYRVEVVPCWWQGINHVLINTNMPYSGNGGTNGWTGPGLPPLP